MIKFLIEGEHGIPTHSFHMALIEAINYHKWRNINSTCDFKYVIKRGYPEKLNKDIVPIGSVEFVNGYIEKFYGFTPKPINIPECLMGNRYTHRNVINGTEKDVVGYHFIKSNDRIKDLTGYYDEVPPGNYQISDYIDIESEYRVFVYKGNIVGIKHYSGDFTVFVDINSVKTMVENYKDAPIAYTLDVGINSEGTFIIEVHNFFSCGLYGFNDYVNLPYMYHRAFNEIIVNKKVVLLSDLIPSEGESQWGVIEIAGLKFADVNLGTDEENPYGKYYNWDDAMKACPNGWYLPTQEEWAKFCDNTTHEWVENKETINGMKFTDKLNGNSIFLPGNELYMGINCGYYWSSLRQGGSYESYSLEFYDNGIIKPNALSQRSYAFSVRCIQD